jgi:hypothetical protein
MVNKYAKGYRFENQLVNKLKKEGAEVVWRTAGSHGCFDVGCIKGNTLYLYQLKNCDLTANEICQAISKFPDIPVELKVKKAILYKQNKAVCEFNF